MFITVRYTKFCSKLYVDHNLKELLTKHVRFARQHGRTEINCQFPGVTKYQVLDCDWLILDKRDQRMFTQCDVT